MRPRTGVLLGLGTALLGAAVIGAWRWFSAPATHVVVIVQDESTRFLTTPCSPTDPPEEILQAPGKVIIFRVARTISKFHLGDTVTSLPETPLPGDLIAGKAGWAYRLGKDRRYDALGKVDLAKTDEELASKYIGSARRPAPRRAPLTADEYWAWASKKNTAQAYRCFLFHHASDPRAGMARERWESLDLAWAKEKGTRSAFREYLATHGMKAGAQALLSESRKVGRLAGGEVPVLPAGSPVAARARSTLVQVIRLGGEASAGPGAGDPLLRARLVASRALLRIEEPMATECLARLLRTASDADLRAQAALALSGTTDPRASKALTAALEDAEPEVRRHAARAVAESAGPDGANALGVATCKSLLLGRVEIPSAVAEAGGPAAAGALKEALKDPHDNVRKGAARGMRTLGDPGLLPALQEAMADSESGVRMEVVQAIGKLAGLGEKKALAWLLRGMDSLDPQVRVFCTLGLGSCHEPAAAASLVGALRDPVTMVRWGAVGGLGGVGDPTYLPEALAYLKDTEVEVREWAARALGGIGDSRAMDALVGALGDRVPVFGSREGGPVVAKAAIEALGEIGDVRALGPLANLLNDRDPDVRRLVVEAIGKLDPDPAPEALLKAMGDSDADVRLPALIRLSRDHHAKRFEVLAWATKDPNSAIRFVAVGILGAFDDPSTLAPVLDALKDSDPQIREGAAGVLGNSSDPRAMEALLSAYREGRAPEHRIVDAFVSDALRRGPGFLRQSLSSEDPRMRQAGAAAISGLAERRRELLFGEVRETEQKGDAAKEEPEVRRAALLDQVRTAGSRVGTRDADALAKLRGGLKSTDVDIQIAAIGGLARSKDRNPALAEDLKKALAQTPSETVKLKITGELAKLGDEGALKGIRELVKSGDPVDRMYAAEVLGEAKPGEVAEELVKALDDPDPLVRVHAAAAVLRTLQANPEAPAASPAEKDADK